MAALSYEELNKEKPDDNWRAAFIEELKTVDELADNYIYQGFYLDRYLMYPQGLTIEELRLRKKQLSYIFYPEGGRFKGGEHRYLYLNNTLYERREKELSTWHFKYEDVEIPIENEKPYCFRGKILSFAQHQTGGQDKRETYLVFLYRGDDLQYYLYVDFFDIEGRRPYSQSIILSPSPKMIYGRLQSKLSYQTDDWDSYSKHRYIKFMEEIRGILTNETY